MPTEVYLPIDHPDKDAPVIEVAGKCYVRLEETDRAPTINDIDATFLDCDICLGCPTSSSGSSGSSSGGSQFAGGQGLTQPTEGMGTGLV